MIEYTPNEYAREKFGLDEPSYVDIGLTQLFLRTLGEDDYNMYMSCCSVKAAASRSPQNVSIVENSPEIDVVLSNPPRLIPEPRFRSIGTVRLK